jgi:septum formation protein
MKLILASASERRHELLKRLTSDFEIMISSFEEEKVQFDGSFGEYVKEISKGKAIDIGTKLKGDFLILGCDTIVSFNGKVLGKPKDKEEAKRMLMMLSGNVHQVYSGITLYQTLSQRILSDFIMTDVRFSHLSEKDIDKYIETEEPMDKAGAYGIQGYGGVFVEEIHGCYYNVVGLPINKLKYLLQDMGVNL